MRRGSQLVRQDFISGLNQGLSLSTLNIFDIYQLLQTVEYKQNCLQERLDHHEEILSRQSCGEAWLSERWGSGYQKTQMVSGLGEFRAKIVYYDEITTQLFLDCFVVPVANIVVIFPIVFVAVHIGFSYGHKSLIGISWGYCC